MCGEGGDARRQVHRLAGDELGGVREGQAPRLRGHDVGDLLHAG